MKIQGGIPIPTRTESMAMWIQLSKLRGLSLREKHGLLEKFGSIEQIFLSEHTDIESCLQRKLTARFVFEWRHSDKEYEWSIEPCNWIVNCRDKLYPKQLLQLVDPPLVLYIKGDPEVLQTPQIAIVGSRRCSPVGRKVAMQFATELAYAGLTVTSGLALGVDAAAHEGCLLGDGLTVAVEGNGLDKVYPMANAGLADKIHRQGCLLSELPLGSPPRKEHFPMRNRLIAALSYGVLVVEAALRSGSLITARLAVEMGKEVFVVPGSVLSPQSKGCHALIQQGALLVQSTQGVLLELQPQLSGYLQTLEVADRLKQIDQDKEEPLLKWIGHDPIYQDEIIRQSGLTSSRVSSILSELELKGLIARCDDGQYFRC